MKSLSARVCAALCVMVFLPAGVEAATASCDRPTAHSIFKTVADAADKLACNEHGYWEASFGELRVFVYVPEGKFIRGSKYGLDDEKPVRSIHLDGYWIAKYPVTVGQFRDFVSANDYMTDAERGWGSWQWNG